MSVKPTCTTYDTLNCWHLQDALSSSTSASGHSQLYIKGKKKTTIPSSPQEVSKVNNKNSPEYTCIDVSKYHITLVFKPF